MYQTRSKRSNLSLSIIPRKAVCWSSVDATTGAHTPAKACMAELPPWISAKGPIEIRKREVSFDKWAKWAIQQDMHALAQPVSSITATSTADQIAQAKEMDTPVKFQGGKRQGSKSIKIRGGKRLGCWSSVDAAIAVQRLASRSSRTSTRPTCSHWARLIDRSMKRALAPFLACGLGY